MKDLTYLQCKPAKTDEISPEAQLGFLGSFLTFGKRTLLDHLLWRTKHALSLEIRSAEQKTQFYVTAHSSLASFLMGQLVSRYPRTLVTTNSEDPMIALSKKNYVALATVSQAAGYPFMLKTYQDFKEGYPLTGLLGFMAKLAEHDSAYVQVLTRIPNQAELQRRIREGMRRVMPDGTEETSPYKAMFERKLKTPLVEMQYRLGLGSKTKEDAQQLLQEMAGSLGAYTMGEGNGLRHVDVKGGVRVNVWKKMWERSFYWRQSTMVLNLEEAASLWHLPDESMSGLKAINWGKVVLAEPPDNLPVVKEMNEEQRQGVNFFAVTDWKNQESIFGIKPEDRRKHIYVIGKTGSGKSTLIANMAINDIRQGNGIAVIDPHGDLSEMILDYVPKRRANDVIFLDPTIDEMRAFALNLFDAEGAEHTDLIASGIVGVFYKLYHHSWGPRLEYILRNTILTLLYTDDATFVDIIRLLTDGRYRSQVVTKIAGRDQLLAEFWLNEFEQMTDKLRVEAISPILNKVGQFLSSQRIRNIVSQQRSTFSFDEVLNQGKILLVNLSQGKLGEDTTALLGAMFITKIQLTAMRRVSIPEHERKDFYLYVDEFQNFATQSFVKILSEARKYHLNLILANQYIGQVDEDIQKAIFGNVGTLISFVVGARDGALLSKEFGGAFTEEELVGLGKFEVFLKMAIEGLTSVPFMAKTLPLPSVVNENKEKIIRSSLERYYRKV